MRYRAASLVCGLTLIAIGGGPGQLTSELAQALLDEQLGEGAVEVVGMRATSESEAVARVTRSGSSTDPDINVTFTLFDTGWRLEKAEMAGQIFPLALQLIDAIDHGRQRRTMGWMRNIAVANGVMRIDIGHYAQSLAELETGGYVVEAPESDEWGNAFVYSTGVDTYTLTTLGSDGQAGPAPPSRWPNSPYEPDIVLRNGMFTQAPTGQ